MKKCWRYHIVSNSIYISYSICQHLTLHKVRPAHISTCVAGLILSLINCEVRYIQQSCFKINFFRFIYLYIISIWLVYLFYIPTSVGHKSFSGEKRSCGVLSIEGFRDPAVGVCITDTGRCGWMLLRLPCYRSSVMLLIWGWFNPQHQESRIWRTNCILHMDSALALISFLSLSSPDNFQDQMKRELAYREEMVQQLQIVRAISAYRHV